MNLFLQTKLNMWGYIKINKTNRNDYFESVIFDTVHLKNLFSKVSNLYHIFVTLFNCYPNVKQILLLFSKEPPKGEN